jgi:uncharacterized Zn ribbon protein
MQLLRKFKKIFAGSSSNIGVFGSAAALDPQTSTDPAVIESLSAFTGGWEDATQTGNRLPTIEDLNALKYDTDYHLAYIYQDGLQNYNSLTTYYEDNFVREETTGKIWKSLIDDNTGNSLTEGANWTLVGDLAQLKEATTTQIGTALLPKQVTISNNTTDADHDLDFTAGNFTFDDGSGQAVIGALTKRFDATWVAGTNAGGLDTGSLANNTPYYIYQIYNPSTGVADIIATATFGSPTLPSGFTKKRHFGDFFTDGSANIRAGTWTYGNDEYEFEYASRLLDVSLSTPSTGQTTYNLSIPLNVFANVIASGNTGTTGNDRISFNFGSSSESLTNLTDVNTAMVSSIGDAQRHGRLSRIFYTNDRLVKINITISDTARSLNVVVNGWKRKINT